MPFLIGPAPIRRTLPYLGSGFLQLKDRVSIIEIHYNMYWKKDHKVHSMKYYDEDHIFDNKNPFETSREKEVRLRQREGIKTERDYSFTPFGTYKRRLGPRAIYRDDNHLGMREFYFWEVPRLQFQNPEVQIVRFLERSPLPFLRVWLNENKDTASPPQMRDVLFDCDGKDRFQIINQLVKTLGIPKETQERNLRIKNQENMATWGLNRRYACACQVPDQVPCPGLIPLPMRMRGKYTKYKTDELEAWENDLDRPYPTGPEIEKVHVAFPVKSHPPLQSLPGLETMYMRKPRSLPKSLYPMKDPDKIVAEYQSDRLDKQSDIDLFKSHKKK